jgi:hypothetical protein
MATDKNIKEMLEMMKRQMEQMENLRIENNELRATTQISTQQQQRPRTKAPDRPTVNTNTDEREWELFKDSWSRYKLLAGIMDDNLICMELRAACSQEVNKLLFEYVGASTLNLATEEQLMVHIKSIAVKGTCKEVHRMNFFKLIQMDGETVTRYVARLRAQAILCQFKITHTDHDGEKHQLSYVDDMVSQQLISGLRNQHHQTQVLSEASTLTTLQSKIDRLQCLETTMSSTDQMRTAPPHPTNSHSLAYPIRSSYKRESNPRRQTSEDSNPRRHNSKQTLSYGVNSHQCRGCGRSSHEGKTTARKDCPAFDKVCRNCGIKGHFHAVCQKKNNEHQSSRANAAANITDDYSSEEDASFAFATQDFRLSQSRQKLT